jgi:hypothetical protein
MYKKNIVDDVRLLRFGCIKFRGCNTACSVFEKRRYRNDRKLHHQLTVNAILVRCALKREAVQVSAKFLQFVSMKDAS